MRALHAIIHDQLVLLMMTKNSFPQHSFERKARKIVANTLLMLRLLIESPTVFNECLRAQVTEGRW